MTLVGFVLTYPQGQLTPAARSAIDLSVSVFDIFGKQSAVTTSAANIVRHLCVKIDYLREQSRAKQEAGMVLSQNFVQSDEQTVTDNGASMIDSRNAEWGFYDMNGGSNDLFDMALGIDFWGDLDTLWPNMATLTEF
jgi:hypothetical protein